MISVCIAQSHQIQIVDLCHSQHYHYSHGISGLEFAFTQSPFTLQATITGIFYFYGNLGELVGALLVPLINTITAGKQMFFQKFTKK